MLKIDYEFGNGTVLRSVTGYQDGQSEYRADLDGTSAGNNIFGDLVEETIFSQELNLISSDAGKFKWILGAYYQDDKIDFPPGEFYIGIPAGFYLLDGDNPKEAWAVFGQAGFQLSDRFELQVGARYSDHKTTNHVNVNQYGLPLTQDQSASFSDTSGKVALNFEVNDHHFLYALRRHGLPAGWPERAGGPGAAGAVHRRRSD